MKRSIIVKLLLIISVIAVSIYLYHAGKGHIIYLDTNSIGEGENALRAPELCSVYVDNAQEPEEMGRAERAMVQVVGAKHTIKIIDTETEDELLVKEINIPVSMRDVVISIPAMLHGSEMAEIMQPFSILKEHNDDDVELTIQQDESDVIQLEKTD